MTADHADALVLTYEPAGRARRREVFELHAGDGATFRRSEQVEYSDGWREVGSELVDSVTVVDGRNNVANEPRGEIQ